MIDKGYKLVLKDTKVKGKVEIGKQVARDNVMYPNMDKEDLIAIKKRLNKKEFKFNDYIPNSMRVRRPGSPTTLASTMVVPSSLGSLNPVTVLPGGAVMGSQRFDTQL